MFFPPSHSGHRCFFLQANGGELLIFAFGKLAAFALSVALGCIWGSKGFLGGFFGSLFVERKMLYLLDWYPTAL